jgi:predicted Fe-Mo cluster-binding NifX family protein
MIIAIASEGKDKNASISIQPGRAPFYLIFKNKNLIDTIKNPFTMGGGGAGFGVAKMLADKKVDLVIAGKFGPNMESALKERKIKYKEHTGIIKDIL